MTSALLVSKHFVKKATLPPYAFSLSTKHQTKLCSGLLCWVYTTERPKRHSRVAPWVFAFDLENVNVPRNNTPFRCRQSFQLRSRDTMMGMALFCFRLIKQDSGLRLVTRHPNQSQIKMNKMHKHSNPSSQSFETRRKHHRLAMRLISGLFLLMVHHALPLAQSLSLNSIGRGHFLGPWISSSSSSRCCTPTSYISMDLEGPPSRSKYLSPQALPLSVSASMRRRPTPRPSAQSPATPYFQHFWDDQLQAMRQRLENLQELPVASRFSGNDLSLLENHNSRMVTKTFESDAYRYIRMTLLDGEHTQVFTSVWYPRAPDVPILACDLLQFGRTESTTEGSSSSSKRHLCIVDYQPVVLDDDDHAYHAHQQQLLQPVRSLFPQLHGEMSQRFYPKDAPYFSKQMILGRHMSGGGSASASASPSIATAALATNANGNGYESASDMVHDVFGAWQQYMHKHIDWTHQTKHRAARYTSRQQVRERQRQEQHAAYDAFSAQYDPALPMLGHLYGSETADDYVHGVLFPLSRLSGVAP